ELPDLAAEGLVTGLIERLRASGRVLADDRKVARKDHQPKLSQNEHRLKTALEQAIRDGGLTPPDLSELQALAGTRAGIVPELLALLVDEGSIVEIGRGFFPGVDAETGLRRRVADRLAVGNGLTMAELRDLLGTSRKFAVPIGE